MAARLIIEITETAAIHDIDNARGFVSRVRDLGARIAIDDFGAGYTSFRNLRKLGVDMIKIDGAFIEKLVRSDDDRAFVRAMIDLGRRLNMKTVAEWVQDFYSIDTAETTTVVEDPLGPTDGGLHLVRGASWRSATVTDLRVAARNYSGDSRDDLGFRIARSLQ